MILVEEKTTLRSTIRCPYHSWCYNFDGSLRTTPHVGGPGNNLHDCIKRDELGLIEVRRDDRCHMTKLAVYIYVLAMPVIAGALVTGVLTVRNYEPVWLLYAAIAGAEGPLAAVPVAIVISREITKGQKH
jgi:hypothetical protein